MNGSFDLAASAQRIDDLTAIMHNQDILCVHMTRFTVDFCLNRHDSHAVGRRDHAFIVRRVVAGSGQRHAIICPDRIFYKIVVGESSFRTQFKVDSLILGYEVIGDILAQLQPCDIDELLS